MKVFSFYIVEHQYNICNICVQVFQLSCRNKTSNNLHGSFKNCWKHMVHELQEVLYSGAVHGAAAATDDS